MATKTLTFTEDEIQILQTALAEYVSNREKPNA